MRALFVAPYLPTPGSGGRTRLINFMERLARDHDLSLVAFAARDQSPEANPYPGTVLPPPSLRERPVGARAVVRFYREKLLDPMPAYVSWLWTPQMAAAIADAVARFRPHVVQVCTTEMAQYLPAVPAGPARALDLQDVASRWFGRTARHGSRQQRAMMAWELLKTRRYETRHSRMPDVVFVSSAIERDFLRALSGVDATEVPNGADARAFAPMRDVAEEANRILFVGPLTYDANLDGIRWFAGEVLPHILAEAPDVRVWHVGERADVHLPTQVVLHGWVDDVRRHLARAALSIVPVRLGSGTRYKILEALSMERAVVSTTVGAEGLGVRDGEHLLIADDPDSFARACVRLLRDPALRARLGAAGRAHVAARYDWEPLVARVAESWERIANTSQE